MWLVHTTRTGKWEKERERNKEKKDGERERKSMAENSFNIFEVFDSVHYPVPLTPQPEN